MTIRGRSAADSEAPLVEVVVHDVPVATYLAARRHLDLLLQEAAAVRPLVACRTMAAPHAEVILALEDLVAEAGDQHLGVSSIVGAAGPGVEVLHVSYLVEAPRAVLLIVRILDLVEEADLQCREGVLQTAPADPDVRHLRRRWRAALAAAIADHEIGAPA